MKRYSIGWCSVRNSVVEIGDNDSIIGVVERPSQLRGLAPGVVAPGTLYVIVAHDITPPAPQPPSDYHG